MYTVHLAKTNLLKLLRKAARGKTPVVKPVALSTRKKKRVPGRLTGKIWYTPDVLEPLPKEELSEWGIK